MSAYVTRPVMIWAGRSAVVIAFESRGAIRLELDSLAGKPRVMNSEIPR